MDLRFKHPFTMVVAGPTSSGKSFFTKKVLSSIDEMCDTKITKIIWCYGGWQPLYESSINPNLDIEFREGVPQLADFDGREPALIVLDDLMRESGNAVVDIFTKGSHHKNLIVIYITQNIFHKGKGQRDISLNAHYIVLFKNPRDKNQIAYLARQIFPENTRFIQEAYHDATLRKHGYLICDLRQDTPETVRIRTNILPGESPCYLYQPKLGYKYKSGS